MSDFKHGTPSDTPISKAIDEADVNNEMNKLLGEDTTVISDNNANSDEDKLEASVDNCEHKTIDSFINEELWDKIGKKLEDYDENDMDMLRWGSLEDCINFYYTYARVKGFGVRKDITGKSKKDGHVYLKKLVCHSEGYRREKWNQLPNRQRDPKPITRCRCQAFIQFRLHEEYKFWKVEKFNAEHNHDMVDPKQVSYIRLFRTINEANESKIETMRSSGIAPNKMMRQFVNEAGSHENVEFIKKDLYNRLQRIKREEVNDGDAETVLAYLFGQKTADPFFFFSYTRDDKGNLEKLFWCDGISRIDYKTFGHVLAFDTTYKCNAYNKPFVVLVGINHHRNTVPFGCALVVNEKEATFVWVLEQLIEAGDGFIPLAVITDGDKAMANAIALVLPEAKHRLCLWHVMRNVKSHYKKEGFLDGFMKCVKCRTPDDFENTWKELMSVHDVEKKKWAIELYETKEKWAEAYMRGHFYAGMRSTQRCESMNRTVKKMLDKKVFLYNFVQHYHEELNTLRYEEGRQDYKTSHEQPVCVGILSSLKWHASTIYTRNAFTMLCSEMLYEVYYLVKEAKSTDGTNGPVFYWLQHVEYENSWYLVVNDITNDTMYCCCMKLESVGFPCRHMFAVLKYLHAKKLPSGCILRRWTRYAKEDLDLPKENEEVECNNAITVKARYSSLISLCMKICHRASHDTFQGFKDIRDQFAKMSLNLHDRKVTPKKRSDNSKEYIGIGDPVIIETGRGRRKKSKVRASASVSTKLPPSKNDLSPGKEPTPNSSKVNKPPETSPTKAFEQMDTVSNFSTLIMNHMPNTYKKGDLSQEPCTHELNTMEDDASVFDFNWKPHNEC